MLRYVLPVLLAGSCCAATITIDQTTTYIFTNPSWATPQSAPNPYGDSYTADLAEIPVEISYLSFVVRDLNGIRFGAGAEELTSSGSVLVSTYLPFTPGQEFYFTIEDLQPGVATSLDLNEAFFTSQPVDPDIGTLSISSPEPATWMLGPILLAGFAISRWRKSHHRRESV